MESELLETVGRAVQAIHRARYVIAMVGAGMSVESGIRPFRGTGGLWTEFGEPDMRGYERFLQDPKAWWMNRLQGSSRPGAGGMETAQPNPGHYALVDLERMGILKHIITQNVDNLHRAAGSSSVAEIHGNRTFLRCIECQARFHRDDFLVDPQNLPPHCPECGGIVKGDTVGFGEPIPRDVLDICQRETARCDCMLLLGTSAVVYPAAAFPSLAKQQGATLIEVNTEGSALTGICDIVIAGPSGQVLPILAQGVRERLGA